MKLEIEQEVLRRELGMTQQLIAHSQYGGLFALDVNEQTLTIRANDMENSFHTSMECAVQEVGAVCLQGRKLTELVKLLPSGKLTMAQADKNGGPVRIRVAQDKFQLVTMPRDSFPQLEPSKISEALVVPSKTLRAAIEATSFALPSGDHISMRAGNLVINQLGLELAVTDRTRIALFNMPLPEEPLLDFTALLSAAAMQALAKFCASYHGPVAICQTDNQLSFKGGDRILTTRCLVGEFPNIGKVLDMVNSKEYQYTELDTALLSEALRKALLLAKDDAPAVTLDIAGQELTISAKNVDAGAAEVRIPAQHAADYQMTLLVNARLLLDWLAVIKEDKLQLGIHNAQSMLRLWPAVGLTPQYLLAPMR
jgi:DNA polymerase III beta subunit